MAVPTKASLLLRKTFSLLPALTRCQNPMILSSRNLFGSVPLSQSGEETKKPSIFSKLFVREVDTGHEPQSKALSDMENVYEIIWMHGVQRRNEDKIWAGISIDYIVSLLPPPRRYFTTTLPACQGESEGQKKPGILSILFDRNIETTPVTQSKVLSEGEDVYQIQFHSVKPECMEAYLKQFGSFVDLMKTKKTGASLVGSWTVEIGDQDEAIHVWKYEGGYPVLNDATQIYRTDKDFIDFRLQRNKMLRARRNQILLRFSFWPEPEPEPEPARGPGNIYELRTYTLKHGTMIEWGNIWTKGIKHRTSGNAAVAGFFSHIGDLQQVHHLWVYESLQKRKEIRESAWVNPGWDETVAYTAPLIKTLQARILVPTPFSPLK